MYHYALVDSSQRPHFHEWLEKRGIRYVSLFDGQAEVPLEDIAPLLIEIDPQATHPDLPKTLESLGRLKPAVSMLVSELSSTKLAEHFSAFHLIKVPEPGEMLLRWYDTRILPVWAELLDNAQQAAFFAPITDWQYFDRFGEQTVLNLPQPTETLSPLIPLELNDEQYARLQDASLPDVVIAQLRRAIPEAVGKLDHKLLYPFVAQQLQKSKACGLHKVDDHVQYTLLALYTSGEFHRHPLVEARLLVPESKQTMAFAEWVAGLPDDVWSTGKPLWVTRLLPSEVN